MRLFVYLLAIFIAEASASMGRAELEEMFRHSGASAVTWVVIDGSDPNTLRNPMISIGGAGYYGLDDKRRVTGRSKFRIGSITKTFTALAALKLQEEGKININDSILKYAPEIRLEKESNDLISIAMLLEHTSGLQDLTSKEFNYPYPLPLDEAFKLEQSPRKIVWETGKHISYSNAGAGLVSKAIENVTKQNYDEWFSQNVLQPLGMHNSQLHWDKHLEEDLIKGYDSDFKKVIPYWHTLFRAFGGMNTTAEDMVPFLLLLLNRGKLSGKQLWQSSSIDRMEHSYTSLAGEHQLSGNYNFGLKEELEGTQSVYGHSGDADGYLTQFNYNRQAKRAYFVMVNAFNFRARDVFEKKMDAWLISKLPNKPIPPAYAIDTSTLQSYVGKFKKITHRFNFSKKEEILRIVFEKNKLWLIQNRRKHKLIPVDARRFRLENNALASVLFLPNKVVRSSYGSFERIE